MRISDWSSDVCSSDLQCDGWSHEPPDADIQRATDAAPFRCRSCDDRYAGHGKPCPDEDWRSDNCGWRGWQDAHRDPGASADRWQLQGRLARRRSRHTPDRWQFDLYGALKNGQFARRDPLVSLCGSWAAVRVAPLRALCPEGV